eukprot:gb/GECH01004365.1/.p1 GENE.gb/GECH01004365.1/~~gb/GECH01004365.1/.p1  ORF type:complete len:669 (+),score=151.32 gb/GECH01004365.1/:1-2007(+)
MLGRQINRRNILQPSRVQTQSKFNTNANFSLREYATKKKKKGGKIKKLPRLSDPVAAPGLKMGKDFTFDTSDPTFKRLMHMGYAQKHSPGLGLPVQRNTTKKLNDIYEKYDSSQTADDLLQDAHVNIPRLRVAADTKKKDIKKLIEQEHHRIGKNDTPFLATLNRDLEKIESKTQKAEQLNKDVTSDVLDELAPEKSDEVYADRLSRAAKKVSPEWYALFDDPYRREEQDALMFEFREWLQGIYKSGASKSKKLFASWLVNVKGRDDVIGKVMKMNLMEKYRLRDLSLMEEASFGELAIPDGWEDESPLGPDNEQAFSPLSPEAAHDDWIEWLMEDLPNFAEMSGRKYVWDEFSNHLAQFYENYRDSYREHKREKNHALRSRGRPEPARVLYSRPETTYRTAIKIRDGFGPLTPQVEKALPNDALVNLEKLEDTTSVSEHSMTGYGRDDHSSAFPKTQNADIEFHETPILGDEDYFADEEDIMHWDEGMYFHPFDTYVVEHGSVTNITNKGRVNSSTILIVYGNYHGTCGWGYGKGTSEAMAMENARTDAIRNLVSAPVYARPHHTIPRRVEGRFGSASVVLYPSKKLTAEPFLGRLCELFGLDGIRVHSFGRRNKRNLLRAFFNAIMELEDDFDVALGLGRQLPTDVKRFYYDTANAQYKRGVNMYN